MSSQVSVQGWHFLSNHTQVLLCIAADQNVTLREVGDRVGITERAAQRIVADLVESGYLERERQGRRNHYRVNRDAQLRHPAQAGIEIRALLELFDESAPGQNLPNRS
jgi:DNA-binding IclR family transcriptional regulator